MGIDIVIATYNRPGDVEILLDSLLKQCGDEDMIYIVYQNQEDNKQYDETHVKTLYSYPPNLPKARNIGFKAGTNPVVLFLDDDIIPCDNLLNNHLKSYINSAVGAVAGYIDDPLFSKDLNEIPSRFDPSNGKLIQNFAVNKSQYSISVMGANMSFRRDVLDKIGGFDPCFKRNALWEEIDCAFRLLKKNILIWYNADAKVIHLRKKSGGCRDDNKNKYLYYSFANTAYFYCKFIPTKYMKNWIVYWKYRLEYETRINTDRSKNKHDLISVLCGLCGVISGITRFVFKGKRIGLPDLI